MRICPQCGEINDKVTETCQACAEPLPQLSRLPLKKSMSNPGKSILLPKCPKCGSRHLKDWYYGTPLWLRLLMQRDYLCNECNLHFTAFGLWFSSV